MSEYIDDKDIYTQIYSKYTEIDEVWTHYGYYKDMVELTGMDESGLALTYIHYVLEETTAAMEDKALLGNENVLEEFYNEAVNELLEKGFSKEEIEEIILGHKSEKWEDMIVKFNDVFRED